MFQSMRNFYIDKSVFSFQILKNDLFVMKVNTNDIMYTKMNQKNKVNCEFTVKNENSNRDARIWMD